MGFDLNKCYSHPGKLLKVHLENVASLSKVYLENVAYCQKELPVLMQQDWYLSFMI